MSDFDYVLVGGGLQNGLLVLALRARQPAARIALVERDSRLGGNHTWCFHEGDVPRTAREWLAPLVTYRWDGYRIRFPSEDHTLMEAYSGVSSERLGAVVAQAVTSQNDSRVILNTTVTGVYPHRIEVSDGDDITGTVIVDGRGPSALDTFPDAGFQKFLGLEVELAEPHGLDLPVVMDATVDQSQGYRFMYVLPLSEKSLLLEDTYFHDSPELDRDKSRADIYAYARDQGWTVAREVRSESGVLPMPWADRIPIPGPGPLVAGYRGGWFHPATGYSFPVALRLAEFVANRDPADLFGPDLERFARDHRRQAMFARFLNRLLFRWYPPARRRRVFERVYRLPRQTLRNLYSLTLTAGDQARLLLGSPPPGLSLRHRLNPGIRR